MLRNINVKEVIAEIESLRGVGMLMHNARLINPLDPIVRQMKQITKKRVKTEEDHEALKRLEFEGGLYFDETIGPYFPGDMLEACLRDGAKRQKNGKKISAGVMVQESRVPLSYDGPRTVQGMYDAGHANVMAVRVNQARISRCRPAFEAWAASFTLMIMTDVIDVGEVEEALIAAGSLVGIGDYRPRWGRFLVTGWAS